jgi:hypothetical protein
VKNAGIQSTIKSVLSAICLLATSVITIATSKSTGKDGTIGTYNAGIVRQYSVNSDCAGAIPYEALTMTDSTITEPANRHFIDYGLPTEQIDLTQPSQVSGLVRGATRTCVYSAQTQGTTPVDVFSCYEDNRYVCQVVFYQQPGSL